MADIDKKGQAFIDQVLHRAGVLKTDGDAIASVCDQTIPAHCFEFFTIHVLLHFCPNAICNAGRPQSGNKNKPFNAMLGARF